MIKNLVRIIKGSSAIILALLFLCTTFFTYWGYLSAFYYMTFLSNFLTGIFLMIVAVFWLCNKNISQILLLCFTILMLLVSGVSVATRDFNISNGFLFLHYINPLLMLIFFLIFSDQTKVKWQFVFLSLAMPLLYMIFAFIFGASTGNYIYFYLDFKTFGEANTALFISCIAIGIIILSFCLYYINRLIHSYILKNI